MRPVLRCFANCYDRLMKEAAIESKKGGERGVTARSVKKVTAVRPTYFLLLLLLLLPPPPPPKKKKKIKDE